MPGVLVTGTGTTQSSLLTQKSEVSGECNYSTSATSEVSSYINNEGNIDMVDGKCSGHMDACKDCDLS